MPSVMPTSARTSIVVFVLILRIDEEGLLKKMKAYTTFKIIWEMQKISIHMRKNMTNNLKVTSTKLQHTWLHCIG